MEPGNSPRVVSGHEQDLGIDTTETISSEVDTLDDPETFYNRIEIESRSKLRKSRFRTFIDLTNALLGAGVIVVSSTYKTTGLAPATLLLLFSCFISFVSGCTLVNLQIELGVASNEELAEECFGTGMKIATSICYVIFTVCFTASYLVIGADQIQSWLALLGLQIKGFARWVGLLCCYTIFIPALLTIPRKIKFLYKFQMATVFMIVFYAIVIIARAALADIPAPTVVGFKFNMSICTVLGVHLMTFSLPVTMMPVLNRYNPRPIKRQTILGASLVFCFIVIMIPGILGYIMNGDNTASDLLNSFENEDVLMAVVRFAMFCVATFSYPILISDIAGSIGAIVFNNHIPAQMTLKERFILIPVVNIVSFIGAMVSNDIQPILGLGGAVGMCLLGIAFPAACRIRTTEEPITSLKNIMYLLMAIVGVVSAGVCGFSSVYDLIESYKIHRH